MITALDRKLLRDLWHIRGQALAIALVMACGVAVVIMSRSMILSLESARAAYYDRARFADVFVPLKRAPESVAGRIGQVPGVAQLETRVAADVRLLVPGMPEPATGRLLSLPEVGPALLNRPHLRAGRLPEPGRGDEAVASEAFAQAHALAPGARVTAIINGRLQMLRVVGVALSPEFIYSIRPGQFVPDDRRFGVLWMRRRALAEALDMHGAFNDLTLTLAPGADGREVIRRIDAITGDFGGLGAYGREDQTSHRYVSDELSQLRGMATIAPAIFLAVSAFLVNIVIARVIRLQRQEIAALKAFGYTRRAIAAHYFKLVALLVAAGAMLGTIAGAVLGREFALMYARFFRFPEFAFAVDAAVVAAAVLISGGAAMLGALGAVWSAVRLAPAEAMRPEPPPVFRPTLVERLGLQRAVPLVMRMTLRNIERRPLRSLLTVIGIALSGAVIILGQFTADAVDRLIEFEFEASQRQDVTVTLNEPTRERAVREMAALPGVLSAEPFRTVAVRIRAGPVERLESIIGIEPRGRLHRLLDTRLSERPIPPDGLILSDMLAELLRVRAGDDVVVEVLEQQRPVRTMRVAGVVRGYVGTSATMDRAALNRLLREQDAVSGAFLLTDRARQGDLYRILSEAPRVATVSIKDAAVASFERTFAGNILIMRAINTTFACIIAFGVVYNAARIALAERSHELASLRVLGFHRSEISFIMLAELAILTAAAIPLGLLLGTVFAGLATRALQTQSHRIPLVIMDHTYALSATVVALAATLSALSVRRGLDHLDLIAVLKARAT